MAAAAQGEVPPPAVRPLRRATVLVRDLDRALVLYRDTLGLAAWKRADVAAHDTFYRLLGVAPGAARFAILQAEGSETGMVGLFEVTTVAAGAAPAATAAAPARAGEVALVFQARGVATLHERIAALGLPVLCAPVRFAVPGGGTALEMTCRDFDGALVNLVEPLPAG